MKPGAIVNIKDPNSEFYCMIGEVIEITKKDVAIMFLVRETDRVTGISCILDRFKKHQLYVMRGRRNLSLIRGL